MNICKKFVLPIICFLVTGATIFTKSRSVAYCDALLQGPSFKGKFARTHIFFEDSVVKPTNVFFSSKNKIREHNKYYATNNVNNEDEDNILQNKRDDINYGEQFRKGLELHWSIQKANDDCDLDDILSCSEPCDKCRSTGRLICKFCDGSGYIDVGPQIPGTVGGKMIKNNNGRTHIECPVCNDDADEICEKCMGTGWIANWRADNSSTESDKDFLKP